ncbi:MAG: hypothetical protein K1W41_25050 [Lachnospiraceae bacterium]
MKKRRSFSEITCAIKEQARTSLKGHKETIPINAAYAVFFLHLVSYAVRFFCAILLVDYGILTPHVLYAAFWLCMPPLLFVWGTRYPFYNFRHTKYACLFGVLLSCHLTVLSLIYKLLSRMFLPWIMELPTDEAFTKGMVLVLARLGTSSFSIDGIIQYRAAFRKGEAPDLVSLFVLSIRKQDNWEKRAAMRLHLFKVWLARHDAQYRIPFPVLVVENLVMAVRLFAVLQAQENPLSFYFCPENLLMLYPPFASVYRCEADEEGKVKAVRLAIEEDA